MPWCCWLPSSPPPHPRDFQTFQTSQSSPCSSRPSSPPPHPRDFQTFQTSQSSRLLASPRGALSFSSCPRPCADAQRRTRQHGGSFLCDARGELPPPLSQRRRRRGLHKRESA